MIRNWTEEQKQAVLEAAQDLATRFDRNNYNPREDIFTVGWIKAVDELVYLATGNEVDWD